MDEYHKLERKSALSGRFIKGWVSYLFNKMDTTLFTKLSVFFSCTFINFML